MFGVVMGEKDNDGILLPRQFSHDIPENPFAFGRCILEFIGYGLNAELLQATGNIFSGASVTRSAWRWNRKSD